MWGYPLLILLIGGGAYFLIYSKLLPFRFFRHAIHVLMGRYDNIDEPGQINHYQALSTALAATVGMGNITGVALAITMGGPGAIFWMWITALVGMALAFAEEREAAFDPTQCVLVHGDAHELRLVYAPGLQCAQVTGLLHENPVPRVEKNLADQVQGLLRCSSCSTDSRVR